MSSSRTQLSWIEIKTHEVPAFGSTREAPVKLDTAEPTNKAFGGLVARHPYLGAVNGLFGSTLDSEQPQIGSRGCSQSVIVQPRRRE